MKRIPLPNGMFCMVDDADWEWLSFILWSACAPRQFSDGRIVIYAHAHIGGMYPYMHRLVANAPDGIDVDHRDGNGLNNTRGNLRLSSESQNGANMFRQGRPKSSKYKGVTKYFYGDGWVAMIGYKRRAFHLGIFPSEEEAARMYDLKARELFGEFARPNFP